MFSNAIILLTVVSVALLIIKDADVNSPRPAVRHRRVHLRVDGRLRPWRGSTAGTGAGLAVFRRLVVDFSAGVMTVMVVAVFAIVKFAEGAGVVIVLFVVRSRR